jgi:hypothetical protein
MWQRYGPIQSQTLAVSLWILRNLFPHYRAILSPVAIHHGYFGNSKDPTEEHINERVHWSVIAKHKGMFYKPRNLPAHVPLEKIAAITEQERVLLGQEP